MCSDLLHDGLGGDVSTGSAPGHPARYDQAFEPQFIDDGALLEPALRFQDFYVEHSAQIGWMLSLTLSDQALGFEAADEAFTRAYGRWSQVSGYDNPAGWVYRVGLNYARSRLRRLIRSRSHQHPIPTDATLDRPRDHDLEQAIATLSADHRQVVVLRYYADWSVQQTADALRIAPGTVKSRLSRALDLLHIQLGSSTTHGVQHDD